ncbi:MAG: T9SS type A sorting domain-containing protein [Ignavibacteria bacterium]
MNKKIFVMFLMSVFSLAFSGNLIAQNSDAVNNSSAIYDNSGNPNYHNESIIFGDILRNQNVDSLITVLQGYGVEWTGNYYVVSNFSLNMFYKIRPDWSLQQSLPLAGGTGLFRDMEFAKGYLWGVNTTASIFKVDTATWTQVGTIALPGGTTARCLAWDPVRNAFWTSTSSFSGFMRAFDTLGVAIPNSDIPVANNAGSFYGASYDNYSTGGPYLWISSDATPTSSNTTKYVKWRISTLPPVKVDSIVVTVPLTTGAPLASGGSDFTTTLVPGKATIIGLVQGTPDRVLVIDIGDLVGISSNNTEVPNSFVLSQNYPNPFNPNTTFTFGMPKDAEMRLSVMDVLGREVEVLASGFKKAGTYTVNYDASKLSSGIYFYTLTSGSFKETKKMLLIK